MDAPRWTAVDLGRWADPLRDHGPPGLEGEIEVAVAALGDDAGLAGAAAWDDATGGHR